MDEENYKVVIINDSKLLKNGGRKAVRTSEAKILSLLAKICQSEDGEEFGLEDVDFDNLMDNAQIRKDLSKVPFGGENFSLEPSSIDDENHLLGFHTLENGFTFLGCESCDDNEWFVFFILYFDGKKLRAYIPAYGNTYNQYFMCALGGEEMVRISDEKLEKIMSEYPYKDYDGDELDEAVKLSKLPPDMVDECVDIEPTYGWDMLKEDIMSRIEIAE